MSLVQGLHLIFLWDFWIIFFASLVWTYLSIWDLKRVGKTDVSLLQGLALLLGGTIVVGPAATVAGVWYWRELCLVRGDTERKQN